LGRVIQNSMRTRIQETMIQLREKYREALKNDELRDAFDELWPSWSNEMGAMIYSEILSTLDLLLITSVLDNRREINKLRHHLNLREDNS